MERARSIDFLKGVAILFVVITHLGLTGEQKLFLGFPFWISMAVPILMLVSGYVVAESFKRKGIERILQAYEVDILAPSFLRVLLPYLLIYPFERLICFMKHLGGGGEFLCGGLGPGGYYIPVMVQCLLLFPLFFGLFKKNRYGGLFFCIGMNVMYEILKEICGMGDALYRLIALRYVGLIGIGMFFAFVPNYQRRQVNCVVGCLGLIGIGFIMLTQYCGMRSHIFTMWVGTSFPAALWAVPIVWVAVAYGGHVHCPFLETFGIASWGIFLIQKELFLLIPRRLPGLLRMFPDDFWYCLVYCVGAMLGCVVVGIWFDRVSKRITKRFTQFAIIREHKAT